MWYIRFQKCLNARKTTNKNYIVLVLCLAFLATILASCGSTTSAQQAKSVAVTPTLTSTPTAIPTSVPKKQPTPKPKPKPTPTVAPQPVVQPTPQPTAVPQPTQPPVASSPPILDVRPSSMSIVGHLDCQKNGAYICFARVLSEASNQSNLQWTSFTNVPGNIIFSPASGVLTPGQSVLITITVPFNDCTTGLFYFRGPANTHTISWAC